MSWPSPSHFLSSVVSLLLLYRLEYSPNNTPPSAIILVFSAVVKLKTERRQNKARARALILQMADMRSALVRLHFLRDPDKGNAKGKPIRGIVPVRGEDSKG